MKHSPCAFTIRSTQSSLIGEKGYDLVIEKFLRRAMLFIMNEKLTKEQKSIINRCLWDMRRTPEEFYDIRKGRSAPEWPTQEYAVARLLESVNWFDIKKIFKPQEICALWTPKVRRLVRFKQLKEDMDFACKILHKNTLSHTR